MFEKGNRSWEKRSYKPVECVICQTTFKASGPSSKICSPECKVKHISEYGKARRRASIEGSLESIVAGCRHRAILKGRECDIDLNFILEMFKQQNGLCKATGIPLESSQANSKVYSSPWTITVDRIDSSKGYMRDNVQLVCYMYNSAKNRWTHEEVLTMCQGVLKLSA